MTGRSPADPGRRDVEKRWSDPTAFRRAASYVLAVAAVAIVVLILWGQLAPDNQWFAAAVPGVFLLGGLAALGIGMAVYRAGNTWVYWQGAAWFLLALMLVTLPIPLNAG